jgi:hypothetical protein
MRPGAMLGTGELALVAGRRGLGPQPKEHRLVDHTSVTQMLDDDPVEERRRDIAVPDAFGIHHNDRTTCAHAEAGRLTSLDAAWAEQKPFALEE